MITEHIYTCDNRAYLYLSAFSVNHKLVFLINIPRCIVGHAINVNSLDFLGA